VVFKDLLDNLRSRSFSQVSSIKTFGFSTIYTTLPHDKFKTRLKVEQVDDSPMYLSLYGVLWSLGIQYKYGISSDSLPERILHYSTWLSQTQKLC
jgi:hypothetical protein